MNKKAFHFFLFTFITFTLLSCDVWHNIQGTVVDAETNKPIKGVKILIPDTRNSTLTDSVGHFSIWIISNQVFKKTKNMYTTVQFKLDGYKLLEKNFYDPDSIISLEKENIEHLLVE